MNMKMTDTKFPQTSLTQSRVVFILCKRFTNTNKPLNRFADM